MNMKHSSSHLRHVTYAAVTCMAMYALCVTTPVAVAQVARPNIVWIVFAWYLDNFWQSAPLHTDCTPEQVPS